MGDLTRAMLLLAAAASWAAHAPAQEAEDRGAAAAGAIDEVLVWGRKSRLRAGEAHPASVLTPADLTAINVTTTEDVVKFEPSLVIRRRFIGDANGTLGMRGSNMFQTSRSMVFADGVPLHYLLESRWNGAPRWTMVSSSEIAQVEILYGPFSAEYGGNAMGGVVLIESAIPQKREFRFDTVLFAQTFDAYGFDDTVTGYKTFFSYGDKLGDTSLYFSYNRLESESQPQTFYYGAPGAAADAIEVGGGIAGNDERSLARLWFGDTGIVDTVTNNYKLKVGRSFGDWEGLLNIAYEDRLSDASSPNAYLRDAIGNSVWSGDVVQGGTQVSLPAARLGVSVLDRDSLSVGLRIRGTLTDRLDLEANLNDFRVLRDETRASLANPADPAYTPGGQVTDFGTTGWQSAEAKLYFTGLGVPGLELVTGARYEAYELNIDVFESDDHRTGSFAAYTSRSGGKVGIAAAFAQAELALGERWDTGVGVRWESFRSTRGYFSRDDRQTAELDLIGVPATSRSELSPKFSVGFQPAEEWRLAYAMGRAYRFPIVEELFSQYSAYNQISVANPELKPEAGLHHNLMLERRLASGDVRLNVFHERIEDVIESQTEHLPGGLSVRTFVPIDEVRTRGAELILNMSELLARRLDLRFNLVHTDAEIVRNAADRSLEGNAFPRMPEWRSNLLLTYRIGTRWDAGVSVQYSGDSFGRNDNTDRERRVYGAIDGYTRVGLKTTYRSGNGLSMSVGVDNLTNELAFVAHPWPMRTFYANLAYDW